MPNYTIKQRLEFLRNAHWIEPEDIQNVKSKGTLTLMMPKSVKHDLHLYASKHKTSVSKVIRKLVRDLLLDYYDNKN